MRPVMALVPWGHAVEDFLDPIGLSLDDFVERMTGGWLFGYAAALKSAGWEPVIVCASRSVKKPARRIHASGAAVRLVPVRPSRPRRGLGLTLQGWFGTPAWGFFRALKAESASAMIVQEYEDARYDRLVTLGRLMGLPVYATFQGGEVTASPLEALVRPFTLRMAAAVLVPSARERERLRRRWWHAGARVVDVPNPLDLEEWRPGDRAEARRELHLPGDAFLVVSHGRIDIRRKGLDVLVRAWSRLRAQHPRARLVLIGSGQDADAFRALLGREQPSGLTWIDDYVTDRALVRRWLSAADAYVTASRVEGMPVAPLEAMAMGLPVVATDAHGLPDIFRDGRESGGVLVPRDDPGALAAALSELYHDEVLRARLGAAGRRAAEDRYGVPAVGARLGEVLAKRGVRVRPRTPKPPRRGRAREATLAT